LGESLISVVMPAYNTEAYISDAIDSILAQSYQNLELIIVDDCSSDRTAEIAASASDPRVRLVRRQKNSMSGVLARNDGLAVARGDYIATADSDDISYPTRLQLQAHLLDARKDIHLVGCSIDRINESGAYINTWDPYDTTSPRDVRDALIAGKVPIHHNSILYRRELLDEVGLYGPYPSAGDYDFLLRASRNHRMLSLPQPLVAYRIHKQSVSFRYGQLLNDVTRRMLSVREYIWIKEQLG
jgi:glycosyltransferase involved in cell wall biosynthesis